MQYLKLKRTIALVVLVTFIGVIGFGRSDNPILQEDVAFAKKTHDLLHNELIAALFQEFNETTPDNVANGKQAISLIFNNSNRDMRLIGAFPPLMGGFNDLPSDQFEIRSMAKALQGEENQSVERVGDRWYTEFRCP